MSVTFSGSIQLHGLNNKPVSPERDRLASPDTVTEISLGHKPFQSARCQMGQLSRLFQRENRREQRVIPEGRLDLVMREWFAARTTIRRSSSGVLGIVLSFNIFHIGPTQAVWGRHMARAGYLPDNLRAAGFLSSVLVSRNCILRARSVVVCLPLRCVSFLLPRPLPDRASLCL